MDYFMEWSEWLAIVDKFPKDDKIVLDRIDTELEELENGSQNSTMENERQGYAFRWKF